MHFETPSQAARNAASSITSPCLPASQAARGNTQTHSPPTTHPRGASVSPRPQPSSMPFQGPFLGPQGLGPADLGALLAEQGGGAVGGLGALGGAGGDRGAGLGAVGGLDLEAEGAPGVSLDVNLSQGLDGGAGADIHGLDVPGQDVPESERPQLEPEESADSDIEGR